MAIARPGQRYTIRCPICGYKQKGIFPPASDPRRLKGWETSMLGLYPECPRCGNVVSFRKGNSVALRCKNEACDVGMAWVYFPPIEKDPVEYALSLQPLGEAWKEKAARLAVRFGLPLAEAARLKGPEDVLVFRGRAPEVFRLREEMAGQAIAVSIEPPFPYDVYDLTPEGEFPATEEQLNHLAQMIHKKD